MTGFLKSATTALAILAALPALAQTVNVPALMCSGTAPDWQIDMAGTTASFTFGRSLDFNIPQVSRAEGKTDWPMAVTLIADFDTAIVVVDLNASCAPDHPLKAHVLTQRGQTPILLTGCCARTGP